MHPVVLAITLLALLGILFLPRKYALAPMLVAVFLTPGNQGLLVGGFHLYAGRIVIIGGLIRLMRTRRSSKTPLFGQGLQPLDKMILALAILHAIAFVLLYRDIGAVTFQIALLLDACGGYVVYRYFIQDRADVLQVAKALTLVASVLAVCMGYEYLTRVNVFSYMNSYTIVPWVRDGKVRAQGTFSNSITSGTFGATLFPLFFWLWKEGKAKLLGVLGIAASSVIAIASMSSTGITAYLSGILALSLWPIRKYMRPFRWGIVFAVFGLALAMKAPVWFIVARVDLVGGHGWDRAYLIDAAIKHFFDWWLVGTDSNASWGSQTWDACNEFVNQATSGGLASFVLFILILSRGFALIGKARKRVQGQKQEWFFWCLGAALFAHLMGFWGIDYFDIIRVWWYIFLAMISAATVAIRAPNTDRFQPVLVSDPVPVMSIG
jgi:hypothetical protein